MNVARSDDLSCSSFADHEHVIGILTGASIVRNSGHGELWPVSETTLPMGAHHRRSHARIRSAQQGSGRHRAAPERPNAPQHWLGPVAAAAMSLSLVAPVSAQASTLISIGATGSWDNAPVTALRQWPATHAFADDPVTDTVVVQYPASLGFIGMPMGESVAEGAAGLLRAIESISGRKIIACESQGCLSVTQLLAQFIADATTAPAAEDLIIVMIGNPATAGGGASAQNPGGYEPFFRITFAGATPESQYETVNVTREYDFFADRPVNDPNALAVWNNLVAFLVVHPIYGDVDMDDPDNLVKVVGNTTYVLVPTKQLPMLQSLYDTAEAWRLLTGQADLLQQVEALDARLRAIIDQDYDRSGFLPKGSPGQTDTDDGPADTDPPPEPEPVNAEDEPEDSAAERDRDDSHDTTDSDRDSGNEAAPDSPAPEEEDGPERPVGMADVDTDEDDPHEPADDRSPTEDSDATADPGDSPSSSATDAGSAPDSGSDSI